MKARGLEGRKQKAGRGMQGKWQELVREEGRGEQAGSEERKRSMQGIAMGRQILVWEREDLGKYGYQSG